ncbi:chemotaxis protein methyltransferase Cher2 [Variibacter gotjawalensis]|uniref:protein-glutamate O-methyltransferase n=1 Tax=Variibacter gotjawalensis TaxID=1333996 RepID=A0A0S3PT91_9BRAD|nr:CheR family methyltransferase [Variibacter gotjawalensis]NIK49506.1 chemotaxis protein methyltransferase CheR [Variibacter gotjawalensis]RZS51358.1 chemotaxis protein methyltransferase CheR [Variibacter gotjawalensis]BAT59191.1 chemotaxis protein methyltransferase Cher2 [Variibacter gotjawalensis]
MITQADFAYLRDFLHAHSGVVVSDRREYLLAARLLPLARREGLDGLSALVSALRREPHGVVGRDVVDAMTTGETSFFRDRTPFDDFRDRVLPELIAARSSTRTLRIWSAACSTGQEPYSLALMFRDMGRKLDGWTIEILATDLVARSLEYAKRGIYSQFEVQRGLPILHLLKYFTRAGEDWQIVPEIRRMVRFDQGNLLRDFSKLGTFDVVLCRNVMIYFDPLTKADVMQRLARVVRPDGALLLGGAETTIGLTQAFAQHPASRSFFRPTTKIEAPRLRLVHG